MAYDLVIANGTVVTAARTWRADVAVVGEKVVEVRPNLEQREAARVIDACGKYVMPGGIDVHTHLDMPLGDISSSDDFETGTRAAAFGGTTTIIDYATQFRGESLHAAIETWKRKAAGKAVIDYGFHCTITDWSERALEEMDELVVEGVSSFKVFMAYPGRLMLDDGAILKTLKRTARNGGLICVHAENGPTIEAMVRETLARGDTAPRFHALSRPAEAEAEATNRAIALAAMAEAPGYIVHVSCEQALERICAARARRMPVFAETCPQYLFLSAEDLDAPGFEGAKYVLTPPLRAQSDQQALWQGLQSDTLQLVSTDHCPFHYHGEKERGRGDFTQIPNGGPGIEERLCLVFTGGVVAGRFDENRFVELVSTAPARLFGLYPRKGEIAAGSDADLLVFDPQRKRTISARTHHMRVDYSLYEGFEVQGVVEIVLSRGRVVVEDGEFRGRAGAGQFRQRSRFSCA